MDLPIKNLQNYFVLYDLCIGERTKGEQGIQLSSEEVSLYPGLIEHLVVSVNLIWKYLIETEEEIPYLAGAGVDFFKNLDRLFNKAIDVLQSQVPLRFQQSTGANHSCFCETFHQERMQLQSKIQEGLTKMNAYKPLITPETWPTDNLIEKEYIDWINMFHSIYHTLLERQEVFCVDKCKKSYERRRNNFLAINKASLDKEIRFIHERTADGTMKKIIRLKGEILKDSDPLWQVVVEEAYDDKTDSFRAQDIASILCEHKLDLQIDNNYDDTLHQNLYLYTQLTIRQQEIEHPNVIPFENNEVADIVPADLKRYPKLARILSKIICRDQKLFDKFLKGLENSIALVRKGKGYPCRWSHIFKVLHDLQMINPLALSKTGFAEAMLEVIQYLHLEKSWTNVKQIVSNMDNNKDVLPDRSDKCVSPTDKKYLKAIEDCFDGQLISLMD